MNFWKTKNIVKLLLLTGTIINLTLFACKTVPGPIYPQYDNRWQLIDIDSEINKNQSFLQFFFEPYYQFYKDNLVGELVLIEKSYIEDKRKISRVVFELRELNKNQNQHVRLNIYKGIAYLDKKKETLDLHFQDCYQYGNQNFEDRFFVLEGWNCDHIVLLTTFKRIDDKIIIIPIPSKDHRFKFSQWFRSGEFVSYINISPIWQGRLVEKTHNKIIFFGYNIDNLLKTKKILKSDIPLHMFAYQSKNDFLIITGYEVNQNLLQILFE